MLASIFDACAKKGDVRRKKDDGKDEVAAAAVVALGHVDDPLWNSATLPEGYEWMGPWRVDNALREALEGAEWLYGVNFAKDPSTLAPKVQPMHFVRTRRWVRTRRRQRPEASVVIVVSEDQRRAAHVKVSAFVARRAEVRRRAFWSAVATLSTRIGLPAMVFCYLIPARFFCSAALAYAAAVALSAGLPSLLALVARPLTALVSYFGRELLEARIATLVGADCKIDAFEVRIMCAVNDDTAVVVEVACAGLVVLDPTAEDPERPILRCGAAALKIRGWRNFADACLTRRQAYDAVRFEDVQVRLEHAVDAVFHGEEHILSPRLNVDFTARPPAWRCGEEGADLHAAEKNSSTRYISAIVFGALGQDVADTAREAFHQCCDASKRFSDLHLTPCREALNLAVLVASNMLQRILRTGKPDIPWTATLNNDDDDDLGAVYDIRDCHVTGLTTLIGGSILDSALHSTTLTTPRPTTSSSSSGGAEEDDEGHHSNVDAFRTIWGDAAKLDLGDIECTSRLARAYADDVAAAGGDETPKRKVTPSPEEDAAFPRTTKTTTTPTTTTTTTTTECSAAELARYFGVQLNKAAQNATFELFVMAPIREGHLHPGETFDRLRTHLAKLPSPEGTVDDTALVAMVPDDVLSACKIERRTAENVAKALHGIADSFFASNRFRGTTGGDDDGGGGDDSDAETRRQQQHEAAAAAVSKLVRRETAIGDALESVGIDTDALALAAATHEADLETAMRLIGRRSSVVTGEEVKSLASQCVAALAPVLMTARATLVNEWTGDAAALAALAALDAAILELDQIRRDATAMLVAEKQQTEPLNRQTKAAHHHLDVERVVRACANVAKLAFKLEAFVTNDLLSHLAQSLARHADDHVLALLAERGTDVFFKTFAHLPSGAVKGEIPTSIFGAVAYSLRNVDLSTVAIDQQNLEFKLGNALAAHASTTSREKKKKKKTNVSSDNDDPTTPASSLSSSESNLYNDAAPPTAAVLGQDQQKEEAAHASSSPIPAAADGDTPIDPEPTATKICPPRRPSEAPSMNQGPSMLRTSMMMRRTSSEGELLKNAALAVGARMVEDQPRARASSSNDEPGATELLRIVLTDVEAPLKGLKWQFGQKSFPYASDTGSADATLFGLSAVITLVARLRDTPPHDPYLCINEVTVELERVELFVAETAMSRLYNSLAVTLSTQLRDYVASYLQAALRNEGAGHLQRIDDYLTAKNLWPLVLALSNLRNPDTDGAFSNPFVDRKSSASIPPQEEPAG